MGLTANVTAKIQEAFTGTLADAVSTLSLTQNAPTYNTTSGIVTDVDTIIACRGVVSPIDKEMIDGEAILRDDVSILILQADVAGTPKIDDTVTQGSNVYRVMTVRTDAADVAWMLTGRKV